MNQSQQPSLRQRFSKLEPCLQLLAIVFLLAIMSAVVKYFGFGAQLGSVILVLLLTVWYLVRQFHRSAGMTKGVRWFYMMLNRSQPPPSPW